jgi:hypothetical protein
MQTFLPYPDFNDSMECLDNKRLGNQVYREALTLVRGGWRGHPASKMWRGYERRLCEYARAGADELCMRGKVEVGERWRFRFAIIGLDYPVTGDPWWLGDARLHRSHRSVLLRKNFEWYSQFGWTESPGSVYFWPDPLRVGYGFLLDASSKEKWRIGPRSDWKPE